MTTKTPGTVVSEDVVDGSRTAATQYNKLRQDMEGHNHNGTDGNEVLRPWAIRFEDNAADPTEDGQMVLNGNELKVRENGSVRSITWSVAQTINNPVTSLDSSFTEEQDVVYNQPGTYVFNTGIATQVYISGRAGTGGGGGGGGQGSDGTCSYADVSDRSLYREATGGSGGTGGDGEDGRKGNDTTHFLNGVGGDSGIDQEI